VLLFAFDDNFNHDRHVKNVIKNRNLAEQPWNPKWDWYVIGL